MAYTTIITVKQHAGIESSNYDTVINNCILYAKDYIDKQSDRVFECASGYARKFSLDDVDGQYLYFDDDICAITSIVNGDGDTVDSDQYVTRPVNETPINYIKLKDSSNVTWEGDSDGNSEDVITVTGLWSYSETAPNNIVYAATRLSLHIFNTRVHDNDSNRIVMLDNGNYLLPVGVPRDVMDIINSYKPLYRSIRIV